MAENILQVKNLKTYFHTEAGLVKAVNDVSFNVEKGKTLGIVGESGCGKSITSLSIMGLVERPGKIEGGEILFEGEDLLKMTEAQMRNIRGKKIAMIFQEPMTSLNPVYTIGQQLIEALLLHEKMTKQEAKARAIEMLKLVKIPLAERRFVVLVDDEVVGALQNPASRRLSLHHQAGGLLGESGTGDDARETNVVRGVDDQNAADGRMAEVVAPEKRAVVDDDWRRREGLELACNGSADEGMEAGLEALECACVPKGKFTHAAPVHGALGGEKFRTEGFRDGERACCTRACERAGDGVRVDDGEARCAKVCGCGAFSRADAAGESDDE